MFNANLHMQPDLFRIDQRGRKKTWVSKKGFLVGKNAGIPDINLNNDKKSDNSKIHEPFVKLGYTGGKSIADKRESIQDSQSPTSRMG